MQPTDRRRMWLIVGLVAAVCLVVAAIGVGLALKASPNGSPSPPGVAVPAPAAAAGTGLPPWPAPPNPDAHIAAAGLRMSQMEGSGQHFHVHLDVYVAGAKTPVAPDVGINKSTGSMSEMHTHDATGVIHIEAPAGVARYSLGQFFLEWNVRLTAEQIGGLTTQTGQTLRAFVDGRQVSGDPANIELRAHDEIAIVYGLATQGVTVPRSYNFAAGE